MKKNTLKLCLLTLITLTAGAFGRQAQTNWTITGNGNINATTNFLGTTNNKPVIFKTNGAERMRLLGNGRFGIGEKKPETLLHVDGTTGVSLSSPGLVMIGDIASYNTVMDRYNIQARYNGGAASLSLNAYGGTVYAGNYLNSAYGLVGAGKYEGIYGYTYDSVGIGAYGYSSYWHGVYGYTGGGLGADPEGSSGVYGYNASTGYGVGGYCNSGSGIYGNSVNYIGVYGVGPVYAGFFVGDVYTTGSYLPSDAKLKQNVKDFSSAMDIINKLHPKQYEYRQDGNYKLMNLPKGNRFGLISEDVAQVLPNLVKEAKFNTADAQPAAAVDPKDRSAKRTPVHNETIDFKTVNYIELIPVMIKGMQEQEAVISQQQQQIDELKQLVKKLIASNSSDAKAADISTGAYLIQNAPNPFSENSIVKYYVPSSAKQAQLVIYNMNGKMMKSYKLSPGMNTVNIAAGSLPSGQYNYSLLADGKKVDSKSMVITK